MHSRLDEAADAGALGFPCRASRILHLAKCVLASRLGLAAPSSLYMEL